LNVCSPEEEILFYRLLVVCDDYGRMDARPAILKAQCFPLRDTATPSAIETWLAGLAGKGLVVRYQTADGKPLLAVNKWEHRVRSRPKYDGPEDDGCTTLDSSPTTLDGQMSADCEQLSAVRRLGKGKGKGKGATSRTGRELLTLPQDWAPSESTIANLSREFGLRVPEDVDRYVAAFRDACESKGYRYADFDAAFRNCVRQDWPKFRNGRVVSLDGQKKVAM
jgi:hypothetical protein